MWCGIGPMLSKNFEYTGHFLYFPQIPSPIIFPPISATASASVHLCPSNTTYDNPSSSVRFSFAAGVVDPNHLSSIPPRFSPNAYKSFGSNFNRFPGCKNDRGTQQG